MFIIAFVRWVVTTWSWSAGMNFCPVLPGSLKYYKFFINFILQLNVKSFIQVKRDPSNVQFSHVITSACQSGMKKLSNTSVRKLQSYISIACSYCYCIFTVIIIIIVVVVVLIIMMMMMMMIIIIIIVTLCIVDKIVVNCS